MQILVASSSPYRQTMYRTAIESLGHEVTIAGSAVECVQRLREAVPEVLVLEAPLPWGGSDGVLEVAQSELGSATPPVIVLAVGMGSIDWFQLSRFQIDDFLFRVPTTHELGRAIQSVAAQRRRHEARGRREPQPSGTSQSVGVVSEFAGAAPWSGSPLDSNSQRIVH
jgi:CheY-like chemotaxis protein